MHIVISFVNLNVDTVNGISVHPHSPVVAISTGQRTFTMGDSEKATKPPDNTVSIWQMQSTWIYV